MFPQSKRTWSLAGLAVVTLLVSAATVAGISGARRDGTEPISPRYAIRQADSQDPRHAPDARYPAAGICEPAGEDPVTFVIGSDVASPRCARVAGWQRVRLVNDAAPSTVVLGAVTLEMAAGETVTLDWPVGERLQPGVHVIHVSIYGGTGPVLWLDEQ
jgi:hypothetical protein